MEIILEGPPASDKRPQVRANVEALGQGLTNLCGVACFAIEETERRLVPRFQASRPVGPPAPASGDQQHAAACFPSGDVRQVTIDKVKLSRRVPQEVEVVNPFAKDDDVREGATPSVIRMSVERKVLLVCDVVMASTRLTDAPCAAYATATFAGRGS